MMFLAALVSAAVVGSPLVTLTAKTHTPKINAQWAYVVHASSAGKPASAKLTAQIIDPLGNVYPVQFSTSTKKVTNWPFKGVFRDSIVFPPSAQGVTIKLRVLVRIGTVRKTNTFVLTPHA